MLRHPVSSCSSLLRIDCNDLKRLRVGGDQCIDDAPDVAATKLSEEKERTRPEFCKSPSVVRKVTGSLLARTLKLQSDISVLCSDMTAHQRIADLMDRPHGYLFILHVLRVLTSLHIQQFEQHTLYPLH